MDNIRKLKVAISYDVIYSKVEDILYNLEYFNYDISIQSMQSKPYIVIKFGAPLGMDQQGELELDLKKAGIHKFEWSGNHSILFVKS